MRKVSSMYSGPGALIHGFRLGSVVEAHLMRDMA